MISTRIEMFDIMAAGAAVIEYDLTNRVITWATGPAEKMFGYALGELVGHPIETLVPTVQRELHRGHVEQYAANPFSRTMVTPTMEGQRKNGTTLPVAVHLCHGWAGSMVSRQQVVIVVVIDLSPTLESPDEKPATLMFPQHGVLRLASLLFGAASLAMLVWLVLILCGMVGGSVMAADDSLRAGIEHMRQKSYKTAAAHFAAAAGQGADKVLSLGSQAECLYYLNDLDAALKVCDELTALVPNCGRAAHIRGLVFRRQGKTEEASHEFRWAARTGHVASIALLRKEAQ